MKVVSVNLNQRLGNVAARSRFELWLQTHGPELLVSQEPFKPRQESRPALAGYRLIGTSPLVSSWIADDSAPRSVIQHSDRWHEIRLGDVTVHNVYLSAHSSKDRRELLLRIAEKMAKIREEPSIIVGDFNLAPGPEDGLFGDKFSEFTKPGERRAFAELIGAGGLADATCRTAGSPTEFTFERVQYGQHGRFRCDLALISAALMDSATVAYDHSVRMGAGAFTDHSAIIVQVAAAEPLAAGV